MNIGFLERKLPDFFKPAASGKQFFKPAWAGFSS